MLVYDITKKDTFIGIRNWIAQIQQHAESNVNKILVGNKFDLAQDRVRRFQDFYYQTPIFSHFFCYQKVTYEEGQALSREFNMQFFETSALTSTNVEEAFIALVREIKTRQESELSTGAVPAKGKKDVKNLKSTGKSEAKPSGGCC